MTGLELLAEAKRLRPEMAVVLMTAFATVSTAVEAMKLGAYDYIQKPFDGDEIRLLIERTLEHSRLIRENQALRTITDSLAPRPLVGGSDEMNDVRKRIELVARSSATVLIRGEKRHGQGSRGTSDSPGLRAARAADARGELRPRSARTCLNPSCSATRRVRSPEPIVCGAADSSWPTAARCCWTKSAKSRQVCKPSCFAYCRRTPSSASAAA